MYHIGRAFFLNGQTLYDGNDFVHFVDADLTVCQYKLICNKSVLRSQCTLLHDGFSTQGTHFKQCTLSRNIKLQVPDKTVVLRTDSLLDISRGGLSTSQVQLVFILHKLVQQFKTRTHSESYTFFVQYVLSGWKFAIFDLNIFIMRYSINEKYSKHPQ